MTKPTGRTKPRQADWTWDDAKNRFDEVVRRAKSAPQYVAVRGGRRVAIVEAEVLEKLMSRAPPLVDFLESLAPGLDLERDADRGRDVAL